MGKEGKECPFGSSARFCEHQETYAKDILSAIEGDLVSLCTLDKMEDCPKLKELGLKGGDYMHWKCDECKRLLGRVIRVTGQKIKETRVAWCPFCHRATSQHIATF